jgi:hypothetical protein
MKDAFFCFFLPFQWHQLLGATQPINLTEKQLEAAMERMMRQQHDTLWFVNAFLSFHIDKSLLSSQGGAKILLSRFFVFRGLNDRLKGNDG